jgi:hypothetical protein
LLLSRGMSNYHHHHRLTAHPIQATWKRNLREVQADLSRPRFAGTPTDQHKRSVPSGLSCPHREICPPCTRRPTGISRLSRDAGKTLRVKPLTPPSFIPSRLHRICLVHSFTPHAQTLILCV